MAKAKVVSVSSPAWKKYALGVGLVVMGAGANEAAHLFDTQYVEAFSLQPGEMSMVACPTVVPCVFMIDKATDEMVQGPK